MSDFDIWVDFNSINGGSKVSTLRRFGPEEIWVGRVLIAGDHDGNTCPALVIGLSDTLVELDLFMGMFKATP